MSSSSNCSKELNISVDTLAGLRGGTSFVALLLTVGLLAIVHYCGVAREKKWLKLSIYLLLASSIGYLAVLFISILHIFFPSSWLDIWCKIFGFLDQILSVCLISMLLVSIHPTVKTLLSHINRGHDEVICCKKTRIIQVFVSVVITVTFLTIASSIAPFFTHNYGPVGGWCWISAEKNCKQLTAGLWEQMFLWYILYMLISLTCIVLMLIAVSVFVKEVCCNYKHRTHHQHGSKSNRQYRKHYEVLGKVVIQLIVLVPIILDFIIFALRASGDYSPPVWVIFAIGPPSIGFLIPLSLTLYIQCRQDEPNTTPPAPEIHINSQAKSKVSYGALEAKTIASDASDYMHTAREEFSSYVEVD